MATRSELIEEVTTQIKDAIPDGDLNDASVDALAAVDVPAIATNLIEADNEADEEGDEEEKDEEAKG